MSLSYINSDNKENVIPLDPNQDSLNTTVYQILTDAENRHKFKHTADTSLYDSLRDVSDNLVFEKPTVGFIHPLKRGYVILDCKGFKADSYSTTVNMDNMFYPVFIRYQGYKDEIISRVKNLEKLIGDRLRIYRVSAFDFSIIEAIASQSFESYLRKLKKITENDCFIVACPVEPSILVSNYLNCLSYSISEPSTIDQLPSELFVMWKNEEVSDTLLEQFGIRTDVDRSRAVTKSEFQVQVGANLVSYPFLALKGDGQLVKGIPSSNEIFTRVHFDYTMSSLVSEEKTLAKYFKDVTELNLPYYTKKVYLPKFVEDGYDSKTYLRSVTEEQFKEDPYNKDYVYLVHEEPTYLYSLPYSIKSRLFAITDIETGKLSQFITELINPSNTTMFLPTVNRSLEHNISLIQQLAREGIEKPHLFLSETDEGGLVLHFVNSAETLNTMLLNIREKDLRRLELVEMHDASRIVELADELLMLNLIPEDSATSIDSDSKPIMKTISDDFREQD